MALGCRGRIEPSRPIPRLLKVASAAKVVNMNAKELAELIEWAEADELVGSTEFGIRDRVREMLATIEVDQDSEEVEGK